LSDFYLWFSTGIEHIADWQGYDHILFIIALSATYELKSWKKLIILVTAFTIGHSITLALSVLRIIILPTSVVEFLIPVTIIITCLYNLFNLEPAKRHAREKGSIIGISGAALFFGFIHGLGFSNFLRSMLGREEDITYPLFAFNLGLEAGQILILAGVLLFSLILALFIKVNSRDRKLFISAAVFGIALLMAIERFFDLIN
jgi:hypothetical protein